MKIRKKERHWMGHWIPSGVNLEMLLSKEPAPLIPAKILSGVIRQKWKTIEKNSNNFSRFFLKNTGV